MIRRRSILFLTATAFLLSSLGVRASLPDMRNNLVLNRAGDTAAIVAGLQYTAPAPDGDYNSWYRHKHAPCIGAAEFEIEAATRNSQGRITRRNVAGRTYSYGYNSQGRLASYTDTADSSNNAGYSYDVFGRRTAMTVGAGGGGSVLRFAFIGKGGGPPVYFY